MEEPEKNITESINDNNNINLESKTDTDKEFDIADFIVKHYDRSYSVRKKSVIPRIIVILCIAAVIFGICVLAAKSFEKKLSIIGEWESEEGSHMSIIDTRISIDGKSMEYIVEEKNVISLKVGEEYFKIIYELTPSTLTFIIPSGDEVIQILYKRVQ